MNFGESYSYHIYPVADIFFVFLRIPGPFCCVFPVFMVLSSFFDFRSRRFKQPNKFGGYCITCIYKSHEMGKRDIFFIFLSG